MKNEQLQPWPSGKPPEPSMCGEEARVSILSTYGLDALEDDPELAQITQFAARLCEAPVALVSLVEEERQRFLARTGMQERETPRPVSFCAHAMLSAEPMVVEDASKDDRFETNPLVKGHPHIRFYAGAPLISHEGAPLGSLCVIDSDPRAGGLSDMQRHGLEVLAASVMRRLRHRREKLEHTGRLERSEQSLRVLIDSLPDIAYSMRSDGTFDYINRRFFETVSEDRPQDAEGWRPLVHPEDAERVFGDWYDAFEQGHDFEGRFRLRMANGEWRWHLSRVLPLIESGGKPRRWFGTMTDIQDTYRESEERELLARELSHRIKNIFAVIGGLISLKSRDHIGSESFSKDISDTLFSLSRAHTYVTQDRVDANETLHGLLEKLLAPYGDRSSSRMNIAGDDATVSAKSATPLALLFHELATNCAKYGAFSVPEGKLEIVTRKEGDRMVLDWKEKDGPPPKEDRGLGFGTRLVDKSVTAQLSGELTRDFRPGGMTAALNVPLTSL
ncbi:MAG: GAF domain-containing protein [Pontixanthobacter sp.]